MNKIQKVKNIQYGNIISSLPVKVKGEGSLIGATTGAMIGGLLGTQVCDDGKKLIAGAKCEEIAIVYATIGGAALGYVTEAIFGNHQGYQYIINIDDSDNDIAIVQGNDIRIKNQELIWNKIPKPSPLSFPIITDRLRETLSSEEFDQRIHKMLENYK